MGRRFMSRESTQCAFRYCGNKTKSPTGFCHVHQSKGMVYISKGIKSAPASLSRLPTLSTSSQISHPPEYTFLAPNPDFQDVDSDGFPKDVLKGKAYRVAAEQRGIDISSYKNGMTELSLLRNEEKEYKLLTDAVTAKPIDYTVWKALGFSPRMANWWQREQVHSPYIAALLQYQLKMDPDSLDLSYYHTYIVRQASKMDDAEVVEYTSFIAEVDAKTQGKSTYGDIVRWYEDNWSVESAARHISQGNNIHQANDIYTWEQVRDRVGESDADFARDFDKFDSLRGAVNLRDPLRAFAELREVGLDTKSAYSWVQADFVHLSVMRSYAKRRVSLKDAMRSERMQIIQSRPVFSRDPFWEDPRNAQLRGMLTEYICQDNNNKFGFSLKSRRDSESMASFSYQISQVANYVRDLRSESGFKGTQEEHNQFIMNWLQFHSTKRGYEPSITTEERQVASMRTSKLLTHHGFTPEDGILITQNDYFFTDEKLRKIREEVDGGTPLEWVLAWGG